MESQDTVPKVGEVRERLKMALTPIRFECGCRVYGSYYIQIERWQNGGNGPAWVPVGGRPRFPCRDVK